MGCIHYELTFLFRKEASHAFAVHTPHMNMRERIFMQHDFTVFCCHTNRMLYASFTQML